MLFLPRIRDRFPHHSGIALIDLLHRCDIGPARRSIVVATAVLTLIAAFMAFGSPHAGIAPRHRASAHPNKAPDLVLTADVAGPVAPGAWARLTWTARNIGDAEAARSALTVTWSSSLLVQGASAGALGMPDGTGLVWDLGDLAAGAQRIFTATLAVPAAQPMPSTLLISGHALSGDEGGGGTDNHADRDLLVRSSDLRLGVSGPVLAVAPGEVITHTVQVFNVGQGSAEGLGLDARLGAGMTYLRDTAGDAGLWRQVLAGGLRLTRTSVPGPWTGTISLVSRVPLTATSGMRIPAPLQLALSSLSVDADPSNNGAVAPTLTVVQPDLRLRMTGPPQLRPDDGAEYVLEYDNGGTGAARGMVMTATLSAGLRFVAASPPGRRISDSVWTWSRSVLAAGDRDTVRVQVRLDGSLPAGAHPQVVAAVDSAVVDMDPANNRSVAESVILPGPPAGMALEALPTHIPVDDGESLLTATVRDAFGNLVADGTVLSLTAIGGAVLPATAVTVGGVVTATFKAGPTAGSASVGVRAGAVASQVSLTLAPADVNLTGSVQLAADATEAQPGDTLTYALVARNLGLATARAAVMVIILEQRLEVLEARSEGVTLQSLGQVPPGVLDPPPAGYRHLAWRLPDLPAGAQRPISVTVAIDGDPGLPWTGFDTVFFRAGLQSATAEANGVDQRHQQRVDIVAGDLYTGLELNSTVSSIRPGGLLVYQVTFGNAGQGAILGGTLIANLPEGTRFESWEPTHGTSVQPRLAGFVAGSRTLVWDFKDPLARTSGLLLRLTVDPDAAPERLLQTAVALSSARYDVNPDNNDTIDAGAWLSGVNLVVKASGPSSAMPNELLTWRIDLQNLAQRDNASDVVVKAIPPAGFPILETLPGGAPLPDGSVRWVVDGAMGPGASRAFELRARVPSSVPAGSRLRLAVEASSSARDSYSADNRRELELLIIPGPPDAVIVSTEMAQPQACDGPSIVLAATVNDAFGNAVADGTALRWLATDGAIDPSSGVTHRGVVSTTLSDLRRAGNLRVTATSRQIEGDLTLDVQAGRPRKIAIAAAPPVLAVFGRTRLTGRLWDACDNPARDGERLSFAAPRGRFVGGSGEDRATTGGSAEIDLDVGGESGALPVTVRYGDLAASADIVVLAPTPTPTSVPRRNLYLPRLATHQR